MISPAITLSLVEQLIAGRDVFPARVKDQFERDCRERHARRLQLTILPSIVIYNLLLGLEYFLVPDVWLMSAAIHILVTALLVAAWFVFPRLRLRRSRELVASAAPLLMTLQAAFVMIATESPFVDHYQYLIVLNLVFLSTILHPGFRILLLVSIAILAIHFVTSHFYVGLRGPEAWSATLVLTAVTYMTAMGRLGAERRERRSYLFRLRESLRHAQADVSSRQDELTGLLNRTGLEQALRNLWQGGYSQVAAIMIDIDHFKSYNDVYGHLAGDTCLRRLAEIIAAEARQSKDIVARFGGEEFLVLLPNTDLREGARIAERMRRAVAAAAMPHEGPEATGIVSGSFGIGSAATKTMTARELISAADAALYRVKKNGRDGVWPAVERPVLSLVLDAGMHDRRSA